MQSAGCAKGKHQDIPLDYHFTLLKNSVFIVSLFEFFAQNQDYFLSFENWTNVFCLFEAKFSHVLMSAWSLLDCYDFFVLCLIFTDDQVTGFFFFP